MKGPMSRMPVADRRQFLLDAAFTVIAHNGVDGATTRAICAEAGMTLSTFHYVFESRDALLAALVEYGIAREFDSVSTAFDVAGHDDAHGLDGVERILRTSFAGYIDGIAADPERTQALISLNQYARQTTGLARLGAEMYYRYYEGIAEALALAAAQCEVQWQSPVEELSPLIVAAVDGITLSYLNIRNRAICDRIAQATVGLLLANATETASLPELDGT